MICYRLFTQVKVVSKKSISLLVSGIIFGRLPLQQIKNLLIILQVHEKKKPEEFCCPLPNVDFSFLQI